MAGRRAGDASPGDDGDGRLARLLVDAIEDHGLATLDPAGRVVDWNRGAELLFGHAAADIAGHSLAILYPPECADDWERDRERALASGRALCDGPRVRRDGSRLQASTELRALRDGDGALVGLGAVLRAAAPRPDEAMLRLLVDAIRDYAVFMLDPSGHLAFFGPGAEQTYGWRAQEVLGRHAALFYPPDEAAGDVDHALDQAARSGRFEETGWRQRKDGSRFWANVIITAIRDEAGRLVGFAKITRDLTERRRAEAAEIARLAAEEASRAKDVFLAVLGHELRNPLAPIVTALQLLKLRGDARSSRELGVVERQVKHMVRLVDDLLDVSRIRQRKLELRKRAVDLRDVVATAVELASPGIEQRLHHFAVEVPPHPIVVDADEARLTQVFANLLDNAAKYTPHGGHLVLAVRDEDDEAVVDVRDDGVGIDVALLPRIFDMFVQAPQSADRPAGGLGLGLSLVAWLVQMHGGHVEARSDGSGTGSTFPVRLPVSARRAARPARREPTPLSLPAVDAGRRVLVVDDNRDALELVAEVLRSVGHDVRTACDGPEALRVVQGFAPEVAILDIGLPVMTGYEVAERIRTELGEAAPRLIALSGYGQAGDRERSLEAGFDLHLVKPVETVDLLSSVDRLSRR